jgi:predicted tellurium resistance membrane protein TerC
LWIVPIADQLGALLSVVIIDLVLAGENAIVPGMAAALLPEEQQRLVVVLGIAASQRRASCSPVSPGGILARIVLTLAGGLLLLWVSWKIFYESRGIRLTHLVDATDKGRPHHGRPTRVPGRIVLAAVSMWLDQRHGRGGNRAPSSVAAGLRPRAVGPTDRNRVMSRGCSLGIPRFPGSGSAS